MRIRQSIFLSIALHFILAGVCQVIARESLANYRIQGRTLDANVRSEEFVWRFERVHASSADDRVVFVVATRLQGEQVVSSFEWLVSSKRQGLKATFSGWNGTVLSWTSRASWGGHKGHIDLSSPEKGVQIDVSWDI